MAFEEFDKSRAVFGRTPNVTVQARGLITINQSAYRKMGEPELVVLLFDREAKKVGIMGTFDEQKGYRVRVPSRPGSPASVSASAFFNYYGIAAENTRRWAPTFEGKTLIFELEKAISTSRVESSLATASPDSTSREFGEDNQ